MRMIVTLVQIWRGYFQPQGLDSSLKLLRMGYSSPLSAQKSRQWTSGDADLFCAFGVIAE